MSLRRTAVILAAAASLSLPAQQTGLLEEAVAVFMASNIKLSVDNALHDLIATGVEVDTAAVKPLIMKQLALPYDELAHQRANDIINNAIMARSVEASKQMLDSAAQRPGARLMPDGLVIETITEGSGPIPGPDDTVSFRYTGTLPDGTVFDSIGPGDEPLICKVTDLTPGMTEGLQLVKTGGTYRFTMPSGLGYGSQGISGVIPPDCALQFDIELIEIK